MTTIQPYSPEERKAKVQNWLRKRKQQKDNWNNNNTTTTTITIAEPYSPEERKAKIKKWLRKRKRQKKKWKLMSMVRKQQHQRVLRKRCENTIGKGWTYEARLLKHRSHKSKIFRYFFSPDQRRFRSLKLAKLFHEIILKHNEDESTAWKEWKKLRARNKHNKKKKKKKQRERTQQKTLSSSSSSSSSMLRLREEKIFRTRCDIGPGWIVETRFRKNTNSAASSSRDDKYFFSPGQKRFRSFKMAQIFHEHILNCHGDETRAWKEFQNAKCKPTIRTTTKKMRIRIKKKTKKKQKTKTKHKGSLVLMDDSEAWGSLTRRNPLLDRKEVFSNSSKVEELETVQDLTAWVGSFRQIPSEEPTNSKVELLEGVCEVRASSDCFQSSHLQNHHQQQVKSKPMGGNGISFGCFGPLEKFCERSQDERKLDRTFLNYLLKDRLLIVEQKVKRRLQFKRIREDGFGNTYQMVSCKLYDDKESFGYGRKVARIAYAKTTGPDCRPFEVEDLLLRIGDFTTIPPRKVAARLELFQSPSSLDVVKLDRSDFQDIPDKGYVGGGFIHEEKLVEVLKQAGMSAAPASRVAAIQVRLFIPSMGIYKGMLVKKRCMEGAPIELPCSMKKVLKSTHPKALSGGFMKICRGGIHPSPGSANNYIGMKLDPNRKEPPVKNFQEKISKPLSEMVFLLWQTMGVTREMCEQYKKESLAPARRNHGWLVGVPDPTSSLPPGTIFVPGMNTCQKAELFVTRAPCYAFDHGRKLATVTCKPRGMSSEDWSWLNTSIPFGTIIFSNPRPGQKSIPERIANGDLDGDLYLVCWDKQILSCMTAAPLYDEISDDDGTLATVPSNPNWFNDSLDILADAGLKSEIHNLIGKTHELAKKLAQKSKLMLKDPDANAYYEAYNQALEFEKHGRPITLPPHLIGGIPKNLRHLVDTVN